MGSLVTLGYFSLETVVILRGGNGKKGEPRWNSRANVWMTC